MPHEVERRTQDHLDGDREQQDAEVDLEHEPQQWRHQGHERDERTDHGGHDKDESEFLMQGHPIDRGNHQSGQYCSSRIALLSKPARRMIARAPLIIPG